MPTSMWSFLQIVGVFYTPLFASTHSTTFRLYVVGTVRIPKLASSTIETGTDVSKAGLFQTHPTCVTSLRSRRREPFRDGNSWAFRNPLSSTNGWRKNWEAFNVQEGLLEKIKSQGYWRVNFRPATISDPLLSLKECFDVVDHNRVQLRGWDYPHVQRNEEHGGTGRQGEYFESWTDWSRHREFWRMYRSSQFIHYMTLWEDRIEGKDRVQSRIPAVSVLGTGGTVYVTTEVFEFLSRVTRAGLYKNGVTVELSLENAAARILWVDDPRRMGFLDDRRNDAPRIKFGKTLSALEAVSTSSEIALDAALEIFDNFGWNPSKDLLREDQSRLLNRSL
jgi:hypothetical protein